MASITCNLTNFANVVSGLCTPFQQSLSCTVIDMLNNIWILPIAYRIVADAAVMLFNDPCRSMAANRKRLVRGSSDWFPGRRTGAGWLLCTGPSRPNGTPGLGEISKLKLYYTPLRPKKEEHMFRTGMTMKIRKRMRKILIKYSKKNGI